MVNLSISITANPQKRSELLSALRQLSEATKNEKGCKACRICQDLDDQNLLNVEEIWIDRTNLDTHFSSDIFGALLGAARLLGYSYDILITDREYTEGMEAVERVLIRPIK